MNGKQNLIINEVTLHWDPIYIQYTMYYRVYRQAISWDSLWILAVVTMYATLFYT